MFITLNKKSVFFILLFFLVIFASICYLLVISTNYVPVAGKANTNWGLGFKEINKPPTGNASSEYLKNYDSYFIGDTTKKDIYITFDAGFENGNTPEILKALKKHNVKATFFVVGTYIKTNPELIKQMVADGHIVGNHTQSHPNMSKMSNIEDFKKEIEPVEKQYKEVTNLDMPKFYRPPQGIYSEDNLKMAKEMGYKTIFWSLAYVDWYQDKQPSKEEGFDKILSRVHPGCIMLLHSTSSTNAKILDELITKLSELGYTFSTLDKLCIN